MAICLLVVALLLLCSGCDTPEMKGSPFYTGEYAKRNGPAEQRVNAWPICYYRDPALSVLWPIFEFTEDHTAVRPFFSVYALDQTNHEYNVLWPLSQFDRRTDDNWIFPAFWGKDYAVVFPMFWHFGQPCGNAGGSDSLFPLWILERHGTDDFSLFCPWPLVYWWSDAKPRDSGSMVFPLYWHDRDNDGSSVYSLPWWSVTATNGNFWRALPPLFYQSSNETSSATATLFWAQGRSGSNDWRALIPLGYWDRQQRTLISPLWAHWQDESQEISLAPWLLSWWTRDTNCDDLWLLGGMAHASWGKSPGSHHVIPLYYRDATNRTLLTLFCGWQHGEDDFFYPFTPLAGVRTDGHSGSWLFPLYSHVREKKTGNTDNWFLLLGGHDQAGRHRHTWFWPLFYYTDDGPRDSVPTPRELYATYGTTFWCLPFHWSKNQCSVVPANSPNASSFNQSPDLTAASTNTALIREYTRKLGTFPFWSYATDTTPARHKSEVNGSVGVFLYDYRHEVGPVRTEKSGGSNDYTRARVLWRVWHYERQNGNVSVDAFPAITYDRQTSGANKTSFLWRFYRYEHAADGSRKLDVLFIPLLR